MVGNKSATAEIRLWQDARQEWNPPSRRLDRRRPMSRNQERHLAQCCCLRHCSMTPAAVNTSMTTSFNGGFSRRTFICQFHLGSTSTTCSGRERLGISFYRPDVLPVTQPSTVHALKRTQALTITGGLASSFLHPPLALLPLCQLSDASTWSSMAVFQVNPGWLVPHGFLLGLFQNRTFCG